jgi:hypothetical protein
MVTGVTRFVLTRLRTILPEAMALTAVVADRLRGVSWRPAAEALKGSTESADKPFVSTGRAIRDALLFPHRHPENRCLGNAVRRINAHIEPCHAAGSAWLDCRTPWLWQQRSELIDDRSDVLDRLADLNAPEVSRRVTEADVHRWCALHAQLWVRPRRVELVAGNYCLASWSFRYRDFPRWLRRDACSRVEVDQRPRPLEWVWQYDCDLDGAMLVDSIEPVEQPEGLRPLPISSYVRLVTLDDCPGVVADTPLSSGRTLLEFLEPRP